MRRLWAKPISVATLRVPEEILNVHIILELLKSVIVADSWELTPLIAGPLGLEIRAKGWSAHGRLAMMNWEFEGNGRIKTKKQENS